MINRKYSLVTPSNVTPLRASDFAAMLKNADHVWMTTAFRPTPELWDFIARHNGQVLRVVGYKQWVGDGGRTGMVVAGETHVCFTTASAAVEAKLRFG